MRVELLLALPDRIPEREEKEFGEEESGKEAITSMTFLGVSEMCKWKYVDFIIEGEVCWVGGWSYNKEETHREREEAFEDQIGRAHV